MQRTLERLRAEFLEMPGLRLTAPQVQRLCGVDGALCKAALDRLVDARFLSVTSNGAYVRATDGPVIPLEPAHASLNAHASVRRIA